MPTATRASARPVVIFACLAFSLVLVGALGVEAISASRQQRDAAEAVLRDYAELAVQQFGRTVGATVEYEWISAAIRDLEEVFATAGPLDPDTELRGQRAAYPRRELVVAYFRLDLKGSAATFVPVSGQRPPHGLREAILEHRTAFEGSQEWPYAAFLHPGADEPSHVVFYRGVEDGGATAVEGFVGPVSRLRAFLTAALTAYELLPQSITDGTSATDLVRVQVLADGHDLFTHGPAGRGALARFSLPPQVAGLEVTAVIPEASAPSLVVGGLPYSRLPAVAIMLLVIVLLIGVGAVLWRQEHEFMALREDFVAGASHELRTPLAQIRMFAETLRLQRVRSDEERHRSVEVIDREARRLSLLVENLLQFSSSSHRRQRFARQAADLRELATEVIHDFLPLAAARSARIDVHGDVTDVVIDRDMIRQVLVNLLDNAVKYGPDGQTVTVRVSANDETATLAVSDEGPGIPEVERARVWQRFWRGPQTGGITGAGIGLALVQELVELHGGSVGVEAAPDGGAQFVVSLPREPD